MSGASDDESDEGKQPAERPKELGCPSSHGELCESVAPDCDDLRPVCQGDIFEGIRLPGFDEGHHDLVMLVGHPCSLRLGHKLKPYLQAAAIRAHQLVPIEEWGTSHLKTFPLPGLELGLKHPAAFLSESGTVKPEQLALDKRVAALSHRGILLLQQRIVWTSAHAVIELETLKDYNAPVLAELELLEFWNEELCSRLEGDERVVALRDIAKEFESYIRETGLQKQLQSDDQVGEARTRIRAEGSRRAGDDGE